MKRQIFVSRSRLFWLALAIFPVACKKTINEPSAPTGAGVVSDNVTISKLTVKGLTGPNSVKYPLTNLTDGNLQSIWSAETSAGVYLPDPNSQIVTLRLDTTQMQSISYIKLAAYIAGTAVQYSFDVQVSPDGNTGWVTVLTNARNTIGANNLQTYDFPDTKGKYVRIVGHGNNGIYPKANSYTEVEVYGSPAPASSSVKVSIASQQISASNYISPYIPSNAVDGNLNTNWASKMSGTDDYKYITADLGGIRTIDHVRLSFPNGGDPNRVSRFGVFVSSDNVIFQKVIAGTYSARSPFGGTLETFDFPDTVARYVRVYSYGHTGNSSPASNNSISEFEVWAQPAVGDNLCHIKAIAQPATDDHGNPGARVGNFYYNAFGTIDSLKFPVGGDPFLYNSYVFDHDPLHHPAHLLAKRYPGPAAVGSRDYYFTWKNDQVVRIFSISDETANQLSTTTFSDSLLYDAQGRVAKDYVTEITYPLNVPNGNDTNHAVIVYNYDATGNQIRPGYTYDTKANFLSTDPFLQLLMRDYSRNNPVPAKAYTVRNLPVGFLPDAQHMLPYDYDHNQFAFFGSQSLPSITYTCQP